MTPAEVDVLTGAFTRDAFVERLRRAVAAAHLRQRPLTLLHIDVDELLELNDLAGTAPVDALLSEVVARVATALEEQAPIGRVEGGVFAAFREGCGLAEAERAAHRLRSEVRALRAGGRRLSVSVGIAQLLPGELYGNLLEAAATACVRAKQAGRDAVVCR